jgi:short-subunit dehydrogenase
MNLSNKVVLITGASSGIGKSMAYAFAAKGCKVVLMARRENKLQALVEDISKQGHVALPLTGDVTKVEDLASVVQKTLQVFGQIDVVVANAGFWVRGSLEQLTLEDYERQFNTNFLGAVKTVQATLSSIKTSRGMFVFIGSVAGYVPLPGSSAYCASKAALHTFAHSIRGELKPSGASVALIVPSAVESEIYGVNKFGLHDTDLPDPVAAYMKSSAEHVAKIVVNTVMKNKPEQIISFNGKLLVFLQRLFPRMMWYLMGMMKIS